MITDATQCKICYRYEPPGHTVHMWTGKSRSKWRSQGTNFQKRRELFLRTHGERICYRETGKASGKQLVSPKGSQLYHKAREHLKRIKKKGKTSLLVRYLEAEAYRVHFQLGGMTKGNGKHIGTVLRADQEDNTTPVRQTREQWNCK